ncbi:odorant receptor 67c-like [Vespa mandarinia]|uniref:odorant receptor 67c-like n=1 Tax=Vespa mandarinia TaxID=7446 RepID=UPI00161C34DD|nr:odorant receptor 67c-like [Vespa mandarinia]
MHNGIQNQKCIVIYCYSIIAFSNYKITCKIELIREKVRCETLIFFASNNLKQLQIRKKRIVEVGISVYGRISSVELESTSCKISTEEYFILSLFIHKKQITLYRLVLSKSNNFLFAFGSVTLKRKKEKNQTSYSIMKFTNEEALNFTKGSVAPLVAWPPPMNTSRKKLFLLDVYIYASFLSAQMTLVFILNEMVVNRNNFEIIVQSMCIAICILQMSIKMMICRWKRSCFQSIIMEMENIIEQAAPYEKVILEKYVNRSAILHLSLTFGFYLASVNIILGPIFVPHPLPNIITYPFDVEKHPIYEIIYFQQSLTALQASTAATIDCQVALLLWFTGARFEMLEIELCNTVDEYNLRRCIVKHCQIISYAGKVIKTVRFVLFATVCITSILMVFSGLLLIFSDDVAVKFQFLVMDIVAVMQLFLNSYPAENLIQMSTAIGSTAYDLNWMDNSRKIWKNVCFLIQRSQKPITVSIPGFIPELSLTYYMSFLSSSFSYFTTLRATVK